MFPTLKQFGVGSVPWSPLARGLLCRPLDQQTKRTQSDKQIPFHSSNFNANIIDRVEEIAKKKNIKMAQLALAWVLNRDGVSAPIVGTTTLENLYELIEAIDIKLSDEEMRYLEEPYVPRDIVGHS